MSIVWIYRQVAGLFYMLFSLICLLRYLNFIPHLFKIFKLFSRRSTEDGQLKFGLSDSVVYRASFTERLVNLFKSEEAKRKFLLSWVRRKLPDQNVRNFKQSWCSGIALCALAEATKPGTCPRYDLLLPGEDVNNCRLGMKLIRRSFSISEPMDPGEMADPTLIDENVMASYIATIRYASLVPTRPYNTLQASINASGTENENGLPAIQECEASGSGLVTAIVGRRAKFNVTKPMYIKKKLTIEIEGPNGENIRRLIEDLSTDFQVQPCSEDIEGILSNAGEFSLKASGAIDFDYQKIKAGYYQVSYTPPSAGLYLLSIFWGGEHITNSPFSIKVLKTKSAHPQVKKSVSFSSNAEESTSGSMNVESSNSLEDAPVRVRRQSLFRQAHVSSTTKDSNPSTCSSSATSISSSQDLYRTPSLFASSCDDRLSPSVGLSRSGSILSSSMDRQGTLRTRRRVIKRVVKGPNGKDEVYYPSSTEQSFQRSSDLGSLSLSLSVSCDERLSPYASRSPSPSPVFLTPAPTLASVERQINRFAHRSAQMILNEAFHELSKNVIFASNNLKKQEKPPENVLTVVRKELENNPVQTKAQDTTSSTFSDGISIKTDSMVDDVFDTSLSVESSDRYEVVRPIFDSSNSSLDRYQQNFARPRYESETYFRPISRDPSNIPYTSRNTKQRSRSESDNLTSLESDKISNDKIPSNFTCFKPVSRKVGNTPRRTAEGTNEHVVLSNANEGQVRHPKLKSRRPKERSDQETQCSAEEIKRITGWMSRRERFKSVHHMKEVKSRDLTISKDRLSTVFQTSGKQEGTAEDDRQSGCEPKKESKMDPTQGNPGRTRAVSEPAEKEVRRPHVQPRSKSFGKESTFDSGYSDENGHNGTYSTLAQENAADCENGSTTKRSSPDGDTYAPPKEYNSSKVKFPSHESGPSDNVRVPKNGGEDEKVHNDEEKETIVKRVMDGTERLLSDQFGNDKLLQICKNISPQNEEQKPVKETDLTVMKYFNQNSTVDSTQQFSTYWEELIYHLENDPKFPVHEFISRVKNISMDIEPQGNLTSKVDQGATTDNFDKNGNRVGVNKEGLENSSRNPQVTEGEKAVRPNCCRAQGSGLQTGIVGSKNNFQVCTQDAGDGSLSVSIRGPRRHAVTECSVIYTGDDFYEVLYDVSLAGFYVISVKWADLHISDSPFIVKVSF